MTTAIGLRMLNLRGPRQHTSTNLVLERVLVLAADAFSTHERHGEFDGLQLQDLKIHIGTSAS